jgi:predicted Zn-dependent protease
MSWTTRAIVPLLMLLGMLTGCVSDKAVMAQADDAHKELEPAVITDRALENYVQAIGDRIVQTAREMDQQGFGPKAHKSGDNEWMFKDIRFHLVISPTLNAFTTGGQHIYLYSKLFTTVKTEDEFAAVVAHEFGHIYGRHVQKGMNRQYTILGAAAAAAVGGYALGGDNREQIAMAAGGGTLAAGQFLGMGFTRDDEDEADQLGFAFYTHAGWDPKQFAGFFQAMIDMGYDKTPEIASDHPKLANRVKNTSRRISELPSNASQWRRQNIASQNEFQRLQSLAISYAKRVPQDKRMEKAQLMLAAFPSCVAPEDLPEQKQAQQNVLQKLNEQKAQQQRGAVQNDTTTDKPKKKKHRD